LLEPWKEMYERCLLFEEVVLLSENFYMPEQLNHHSKPAMAIQGFKIQFAAGQNAYATYMVQHFK
jgi:hypothetical protein